MGKSIAESYIERRIQVARTPRWDQQADLYVKKWGKMPVEPATSSAEVGLVGATASNLHLIPDLPIPRKARILARAYAKNAENISNWTSCAKVEPFFQQVLEIYPHEQNANRIARNLTRAAERVKKP